jgi:peptidoglycan/LPS O-acetylase OafA/YrhL
LASERIPELDGLRGLAILAVLIFHLSPARMPLFAAYFVQAGWLGVDLFFVLSGYLITGLLLDSTGQKRYYRNFLARRTLRIFPLYYACLVLFCVADYGPWPIQWKEFTNDGGWWYAGFLGNVPVFIQNKWPRGLMTPLWSLQIEEQFYLTFPFLVLALPRKTLARVLLACAAAAPLLRIGLILAMPANITGTYVLMPCRMDTLAMGGLIAIARRDFPKALRGRRISLVTSISAAIIVWICWKYGPSPWSNAMRTAGFSAAGIVFSGILVLLIAQRQRLLLWLCGMRPLVWIGTVSYGLYLLHGPAIELAHRVAPALKISGGSGGESLLALAASVAAAWVSRVFFESPILRLRERLTSRG